ncbi:RNA 2',3'-cyclic phosphodiesterase [Patescibacteria group bacterium]|nr:RNA 2',3'-cyclic phosphodiesterase [Patescibacteria group bacterium]
MQRRIFIAINLPQEIKNKLLDWQKKRFINSVKGISWTKMDNFHITLVFMGEIEEYMVDKLLEAARATAKNFKPFEISVDRIHIGPNLNTPRMIWLSGPENKDLSTLARQFTDGLKKEGIELNNNHGFKLHITLARARNDELRDVKIDEKFEHSFLAESVEVMESRLLPDGPKYSVLEKIKFE